MGDDELRDELVTLLVAGHETTATALSWALERVLRHPAALERLQEGDEAWTDAVVKETLRLRPPITIVARRLAEPTEIGGLHLPAGAVVTPCTHLVHRRPDVYPDPHAFRPERFLERTPGTYTWIPFGGGVRRCLGAAFAEQEMRVVLQALVRSRRLRAARGPPGARAPPDDRHDAGARRTARRRGARGVTRLSRKEQQAHTRRALLEAATRVFSRHGLAQGSVEQVAAEAGFTKGAFYANFRSKEELFLAILDERFAERVQAIDELMARGGPMEEQAAAGGAEFQDYVRGDPEWERLFFEFAAHAARDDGFRRAFVARCRTLADRIAEAVAAARRRGGLRPARRPGAVRAGDLQRGQRRRAPAAAGSGRHARRPALGDAGAADPGRAGEGGAAQRRSARRSRSRRSRWSSGLSCAIGSGAAWSCSRRRLRTPTPCSVR